MIKEIGNGNKEELQKEEGIKQEERHREIRMSIDKLKREGYMEFEGMR